MPVEFRCTGCSKLLRTPDESAGKKAKCPQCGVIIDVPMPGQSDGGPTVNPASASPVSAGNTATNPFGDPAVGAGARTDSVNPYVSPSTREPSYVAKAPVAGLTHHVISFDEVLRTSWELLKLQFGQIILCGLLYFAIAIGVSIATSVLGAIGQATGNAYVQVSFAIIQQVVSFGVSTFLHLGLLIFGLRLVRTGSPSVSDIFAGKPYLLRGLGLILIITLIYYGSFLLCLAPAFAAFAIGGEAVILVAFALFGLLGIGVATFVMLRLILATMFLVDRNAGVFESLGLSAQFMAGNKLTTFLLVIVTGVVAMFFIIFTCFVGILVVTPFFFGILFPTIYLMATGQPTYSPQPRI